MARNNSRNLLQVLESLRDGEPLNVVDVPPEIKKPARIAVERMLQES
jgi:quinolinate synthase